MNNHFHFVIQSCMSILPQNKDLFYDLYEEKIIILFNLTTRTKLHYVYAQRNSNMLAKRPAKKRNKHKTPLGPKNP